MGNPGVQSIPETEKEEASGILPSGVDAVGDVPVPPAQEGLWLQAWQITPKAPLLQVGESDRAWMSAPQTKFPYRCLPLLTANQLGWDLINPVTTVATWNGKDGKGDVQVRTPSGARTEAVQSHFGLGTITFLLGHLFRTPPGIGLLVLPPINLPRDGVYGFTGFVETDWLPATFTYNYKVTRPNTDVVFEAGEPICRLIPYQRRWVDNFEVILDDLPAKGELRELYSRWTKSREAFNRDVKVPGTEAYDRKWQRDYFLGGGEGGTGIFPKQDDHQTRIDLKPITDKRLIGKDRVPQSSDVRRVNVSDGSTPPIWIWVRKELSDLYERRR